MTKLLLPLSLIFLVSCASPYGVQPGLQLISESEYDQIINQFSDKDRQYSGLYNLFDMRATLLNTPVKLAQVDHSARLFQWDKAKYDTEREKALSDLTKETQVFVSFFTPEKRHDDLHKSKTLWKIFLDIDGRRYEGRATKMKQLTTEIRSFYPDHNSFSTPYLISFPVGAKTLEGKNSTLVITGPVGSATAEFRAIR